MDIRKQDCVYKTLKTVPNEFISSQFHYLKALLFINQIKKLGDRHFKSQTCSNHVKLDPCVSIQLKKCRFSMQGVKWNNESLLQTFHNVTCLLLHKTIDFFIKLCSNFYVRICLTGECANQVFWFLF